MHRAIANKFVNISLAALRPPLQYLQPTGLTSRTSIASRSTPHSLDIQLCRNSSTMAAIAQSTTAATTTTTSATTTTTTNTATVTSMIPHAKLAARRSGDRGHSDHGWLNTYHTFSFADYWDPGHMSFGSVRVLNEDRVAPGTGFPTHPHRDAEIFSYIVSGELTHRDSMVRRGAEAGSSADSFYRMRRGDVQFTTGGTGIAHSEQNEHARDPVHFLQIWALPWKKGLAPRYHTRTFDERAKRAKVVPILSPLKAGPGASAQEDAEAKPSLEGTIPVHADLVFGATILPPGEKRSYAIGAAEYGQDVVSKKQGRCTYVHLIMTGGSSGKAGIRIDGREDLKEGDGLYIRSLNVGDSLQIENIGSTDAELVILDSD